VRLPDQSKGSGKCSSALLVTLGEAKRIFDIGMMKMIPEISIGFSTIRRKL
jgi:hypothetical protein